MSMRNIIVIEFISMDGVIQGPGGPQEDTTGGFGHGGWIGPYSDDAQSTVIRQQMNTPFDLLIGRFTYDIWAPYWPNHDAIWPGANRAVKYVASNTMTEGTWDKTVILRGDVAAQIRALKQTEGPDLHVYGSATLVQTLLAHDLVDAFWLKVHPITFGTGKRLFTDGTIPAAFTVTKCELTSTGVIMVNYTRAGAIPTK
jgi:dihydrofolate reductase